MSWLSWLISFYVQWILAYITLILIITFNIDGWLVKYSTIVRVGHVTNNFLLILSFHTCLIFLLISDLQCPINCYEPGQWISNTTENVVELTLAKKVIVTQERMKAPVIHLVHFDSFSLTCLAAENEWVNIYFKIVCSPPCFSVLFRNPQTCFNLLHHNENDVRSTDQQT